jgi:hypothetical protein
MSFILKRRRGKIDVSNGLNFTSLATPRPKREKEKEKERERDIDR